MSQVQISTIIDAIEELRIAVGELRGEEIPPWWDHDKWAIDPDKPEESAWDEFEKIEKWYRDEGERIIKVSDDPKYDWKFAYRVQENHYKYEQSRLTKKYKDDLKQIPRRD